MHRSLAGVGVRRMYGRALRGLLSEHGGGDLGRSAVVFSPHPDDETLGCGGTIIKKRRAGARVTVVFMTNGGGSHENLISADGLKAIRVREAVAAGRALGVRENDVVFLELEDGSLNENQYRAIRKVSEVLLAQQHEEVFIPYWGEAQPDHCSTNRIVLSALRLCGSRAVIYEYPVWFWRHWPWVRESVRSPREIMNLVRNALAGVRFLRDFRCGVYIGDVLERKRAVLDEYRSQMTRLIPDARWTTLGDICDGEFLRCFFQEYEVFHRYMFDPQGN